MSELRNLLDRAADDRQITADEVAQIRDYLQQAGPLDLEDVKFLTEVRCGARQVCREFDQLYFPLLKQVLTADGQISQAEQFYLLKMLYGDGEVQPREKDFLQELLQETPHLSPEFRNLCEMAFATPSTGWDLGGQASAR